MKSLRSNLQPSSNGSFVAASTASMAANGAMSPRCFFLRVFARGGENGRVLLRSTQPFVAVTCFPHGHVRNLARKSDSPG